MKARAVELVVTAMCEDGAPGWVKAAVVERLYQHTFWLEFLTIIAYTPGPRAIWSKDETHKRQLQRLIEKHGRAYWTVPVAEVIDRELWDQVLEFRWSPSDFEREFPAPVEATESQS